MSDHKSTFIPVKTAKAKKWGDWDNTPGEAKLIDRLIAEWDKRKATLDRDGA